MPRKKKNTMTQTDDQTTLDARARTIVLDYDGRAAKQKGQRGVPHTYSQRILNLYKDGVEELILNPGVNIVDRDLYEQYADADVNTKVLIKNGHLKTLAKLPASHELIRGNFSKGTGGLICRTRTQAGLDWIEEQAASISDREARSEVLEMIEHRRPYADAKGLASVPFIAHTGGISVTASAHA